MDLDQGARGIAGELSPVQESSVFLRERDQLLAGGKGQAQRKKFCLPRHHARDVA